MGRRRGSGRLQSKLSYQICLAGKLRRSFPNAAVGGASQARGARAGADRQTERQRGRESDGWGGGEGHLQLRAR